MKKRLLYILSALGMLTACQDTDGIQNTAEQNMQLINVGGVSVSDELEVSTSDVATRTGTADDNADAAEKQQWLVAPLKAGLDITYGSVADVAGTNRVAILKLAGTAGAEQELAGTGDNQYAIDSYSKWAVYTFKYRVGNASFANAEGDDAYWHGNGAHYFEGQYVPQQLRYGSGTTNTSSTAETVNTDYAPGLHSNQTDAISAEGITTGNYTLLEQYLGMPASTRLSATVARVKLPFRHRLCRVVAYVLIDPEFGEGVTLDGYKKTEVEKTSGKDDPTTTEMHFNNVDVLAGVEDTESNGHHTLTPKWMTARKVIPHFVGESGSKNKNGVELAEDFIVYFDLVKDTYTFPTDDDWSSKNTTYQNAFSEHGNNAEETEKACKLRKINYGKVPVYDIIARPTYTMFDNVMYDEEGVKNTDGTENATVKNTFLNKTNKIDFDLTLSNGLQYSKEFTFDLDANYQTAVYLRISPESVDYKSSGSNLWTNTQNSDDYYGVDNQNGNSLSVAGSCWQRAYTCGSTVTSDQVTDGGYYNESTTGEDGTAGQYLSAATWKKYFAQAYKGGEHHGDYFILTNDITIDASDIPADFVFTGHLDAQDHTITFEGGGTDVYDINTTYPTFGLYYRINASDAWAEYTLPTLYINKEVAQAKPRKAGSTIEKGDDMMQVVSVTLAQIMGDNVDYYIKNDNGTYSLYNPRTWTFATHRIGASALFCGLNGIYSTAQEEAANPYATGVKWEANVHKEKNNKGIETWVPYKGTTTGWRAEVINTKVKGSIFSEGAVVTGNVQNCFEGADASTKVENLTPEYPKYK